MVTPELSPYARATQAGDVVAALSKALCQLDHRVTIAVPRYPGFEAGGLLAARRLTPLALSGGAEVTVLDAQLPTGATLTLFDAPALFERAPSESETEARDVDRAAFLCEAATGLVRQRAEREPFDVVHLHGWQAAPMAALLSKLPRPAPTVLTIHDALRRGTVSPDSAARLGVDRGAFREPGGVSLLAAGASAARAVTALSTTVAADLVDARRFGALAGALAERKTPVTGILNGLDYAMFNPATDAALKSRYDAEDPSNKGISKTEMLRGRGLEIDPPRALVVAIVEAGTGSGGELLEKAIPAILRNQACLLVVIRGAEGSTRFESLAKEYTGRLSVERSTDDALVRRLCAAADFLLLPAEYEGTATFARCAQRYGALPVARATGAHVDAIVDTDSALDTGTGFLYDDATPDALVGAIARGLSAYASADWPRLRRRVMRLDLSWDRPARRYAQVYRQAITVAG